MTKFNSLKYSYFCDEETKGVVVKRLLKKPTQLFFNNNELEILNLLLAVILPSVELPILEILGQELTGEEKRAVRLLDMPWREEEYHVGLSAIEKEFIKVEPHRGNWDIKLAKRIIEQLLKGNYNQGLWPYLAKNFAKDLISDLATIYYSFPQSWDDIKFPGPAFPVGYYDLTCDKKSENEPELETKSGN